MARCEINLADLYGSQANPATLTNFLQADYGDPEGPPYGIDLNCAWSILIFYNGVGYELKWFYQSQSMQIVSTFSQRGSVTFKLEDYDHDRQLLPFIPTEEMPYEIWNEARDHQYAAGYTKSPTQRMLYVRDDLTEAAEYTIQGTDLYEELEREPVYGIYTGKKLGFILRDVINRDTTLDGTDIDPNLGFVVDSFPINEKYPSQILNHICSLLGATYWIEASTRKVKVTLTSDSGSRFNTAITDDNLYDVFDSKTFEIGRQSDTLKNRVKFWFTEKYSKGTVSVGSDDSIVAAFGDPPETEWDNLKPPLQFRVSGETAVYSVQDNLSSGIVQELRLSSPYVGADASNVAYELLGRRRYVYVTDEESIGVMRRIRGDSGKFTYVVSEDGNNFTFNEARRFAQALLTLSKPLPKGKATTYNDTFQELPLTAGRVLSFNLPQSKRFVGDVVVQEIVLTDVGGAVEIGDQIHPKLQIDFSFNATLTSAQAQLRKMMQDLRKVTVAMDESTDIEDYAELRDTYVQKDCIHINPKFDVRDEVTELDSVTRRVHHERGIYYTDLDFTWGPWSLAFTSD